MAELFQVESLIPKDKLKELAAFMCKIDAQDNAPAVADPTLPQINGYTHSVQVDIIQDTDGNEIERVEKAHIIAPISQTAGVITEENRETILPALKKLIGVSEGEVTIVEQYGQTVKLDTIYQQVKGVNIKKEEKGEISLVPGTLICTGDSWTRRKRALIVKALKDVTERYKIVSKYTDSEGKTVKTEIDITWPEVAFTGLEEVKNIYRNGIMEPWLNVRYYANRNDKDHGGTVSLSWQIADDPISKLIAKSVVGKNYCWVGNDVLRDEKDRFVMEVMNLSPEAQEALEERARQAHDEYLYSLIDLSKPITLWDNTILMPDGRLLPAGTDLSSLASTAASVAGVDASSITSIAGNLSNVSSTISSTVGAVAETTIPLSGVSLPSNEDDDSGEDDDFEPEDSDEEYDEDESVDATDNPSGGRETKKKTIRGVPVRSNNDEDNDDDDEGEDYDEDSGFVFKKKTIRGVPVYSNNDEEGDIDNLGEEVVDNNVYYNAQSSSTGEITYDNGSSSFSSVKASVPTVNLDQQFKEKFSILSDVKSNLTELSTTCGDIPSRITGAYAAINVQTPSGPGTAAGVVPAFLSSLKELKTRIEGIIEKIDTALNKLPLLKYGERIPGFSIILNTIRNFVSMAKSAISAIPV